MRSGQGVENGRQTDTIDKPAPLAMLSDKRSGEEANDNLSQSKTRPESISNLSLKRRVKLES